MREKKLEDFIWEHLTSDMGNLKKIGFPCHRKMTYAKQLCLGKYGKADLVGIFCRPKTDGYRELYIDIYELKSEFISVKTLLQAVKYAKGIREIIREEPGFYQYVDIKFNFYAIGKKIDLRSNDGFLTDIFPNIRFLKYLESPIRFQELNDFEIHSDSHAKVDDISSILNTNISMNREWRRIESLMLKDKSEPFL